MPFNADTMMMTLHALFEQQVEKTPDNIALICPSTGSGTGQLSYRQLNAQANRLAHHLMGLQLQGEERLLTAVSLERSPQMVVALLAALKAGGAYVPIDPDYPVERIKGILEGSGAHCLISHRCVFEALPVSDDYVGVIAEELDLSSQPIDNPLQPAALDDLAYIIFTSGSTGRPKGVAISHRGAVNTILDINERFSVSAEDRVLALSSVSFDLSVYDIFGLLAIGGAVVIPDHEKAREPAHWAELVCDQRVTLWDTVPALMQIYTDYLETHPALRSETLRLVMMSGDWIPLTLPDRIRSVCPQATIMSLGGATEASIWSICYPIGAVDPNWKSIPYGKALRNQSFHVLDDQLEPSPTGEIGHLYIGGVGLALCYWRDEERTAASFFIHPRTGERLYRTGDLGRLLADGNIEFLGRDDFQVKIRGFRIELGEIEATLTRHPAIKHAVVDVFGSGDNRALAAWFTEVSDADEETPLDEGRLSQWQQVFDETYKSSSDDLGFNISGWNSSYTGLAIPAEEMREWLDGTIDSINLLQPGWVLEVGCGTGMILFRIAPHCAHYTGIDLSAQALESIAQHLKPLAYADKVTLMQRSADQLDDLTPASLDTVIINSVMQYFPSLDYLQGVIEKAIRCVAPGGRIFIGDVRNHQLLEAFHSSVQLAHADGSLTLENLKHRFELSVQHEEELLVDPDYFMALRQLLPQISRVDVRLKRGQAHNEMIRFRYDVTLHIDDQQPSLKPIPAWHDWQAGLSLEQVSDILNGDQPELLAIGNIPNARLNEAVWLMEQLDQPEGDVAQFREAYAQRDAGVEPEVVCALADETAYHGFLLQQEPGTFAVIFQHRSLGEAACFAQPEPQRTLPLADYANTPYQNLERAKRQLISELRRMVGESLPDYMMPAAFMALEAMPLTANGKVDRSALPQPRGESSSGFSALLTSPTEALLAALWSDLLKCGSIGTSSNFFDLGGNSLLAMQLISRIRESFEVELPVRAIFEHAELNCLATAIEAASGTLNLPPITLQSDAARQQLSFAQQRLWFLDQFEAQSSATYNIPLALELSGQLDIDALEQSLLWLLARHSVLRSYFVTTDGQPKVAICDVEDCPALGVHDLSELVELDDEVQRRVNAHAVASFDLARGPLIKIDLLRLTAQRSVLMINMHHVVSDGWSLVVFLRDWQHAYSALAQGEQPSKAPLAIEYGDYAVWQRSWLQGDLLQQQVDYWKQQLDGIPELLELPTDYTRPPQMSYRGSYYSQPLSDHLNQNICALSRQQGVTIYMTLMAAFNLLLSRYSRQNDICVGSAIAGRSHGHTEALVGFFVNTLVIRTQLSDQQSFSELLQATRQTCLSAYAHQDIPFEMLVEQLQPSRSLSHAPLFQVMLVLQNNEVFELELPDLAVTPCVAEHKAAKFDLTLFVEEEHGRFSCGWEYATDLFDETSIIRMHEHFMVLLKGVIEQPERPLATIPMLTDDEYQQLQRWNAPETAPIGERTLLDLFEQQAAETPDNVAIIFEDQQLSYRQLDEQANRLANHLLSLTTDDCQLNTAPLMAVILERSPLMIISVLAVLKAGAAYVPIDPEYPAERIQRTLESSGANCLLTFGNVLAKLTLPEGINALEVDALDLSALSTDKPAITTRPDDLAYIIFTSGSTGTPKGVVITHRSAVNTIEDINERFSVTADDRTLALSSLSFDLSVYDIFGLLAVGGAMVILPNRFSKEPAYWAERVASCGVTIWNSVPALVHIYSDYVAEQPQAQASSLRLVMMSGDWIPLTLPDRIKSIAPQAQIISLGGATEASIWSIYYPIEQVDAGWKSIPYGKPLRNQSFQVLNDALEPCPLFVPGHLYIGGIGLAQGYWRDEERTAASFITHPRTGERLYKTGDLGRYLADGNIEFLGRDDFQVKIRGFRIELGDIEAALRAHPAVQESLATVHGEGDHRRLVAYVAVADCQAAFIDELRDWLKQHLPEYMLPSHIMQLESFPLTTNGKIDRAVLPQPEASSQSAAPATATEQQLVTLWSDLLGCPPMGREENFFDLGGHSLLAMQLVSRIRERFTVELPVRAIFEHARLRELATAIDATHGSIALPAITVQSEEGRKQLSFAQQRLWFLDQFEEQASATYNIPLALRLRGELNLPALEQSLQWLLLRHSSLRSYFIAPEGQPQVAVLDMERIELLQQHDLRQLHGESQQREMMRLLDAHVVVPFDLAHGPLFKADLLQLAAEDHLLMINMHHAVSDAWSIGLLLRDLNHAYTAFAAGALPELPPLAIEYGDYAAWQRSWLQGAELQRQVDYWQQQLADIPELLELPTDKVRPAQQSYRGAYHMHSLPKELGQAIAELSRQQGTTLFMTLLAAFNILLARYSRQDDLCVGSPIANRSHSETEDMIGFFVNTLVLRAKLDPAASFNELLQATRQTCLAAYAHQDIPFEMLVEALQPARSMSHAPLFQVMLVVQNEMPPLTLPGLAVEQVAGEYPIAKFDLTLFVEETADGLHCGWEYATDLFSGESIARMSEHFRVLLESMVKHPALPIAQLPMLTADELHQLKQWNAPETAPIGERTLLDLFEQQAAVTPDNIAIIFEDQQLSYRQLNEQANRLANHLLTLPTEDCQLNTDDCQLNTEPLMAVVVERSPLMIISVLAVLKAGAAYVPIDPEYPAERIQRTLESSGASCLLTQGDVLAKLTLPQGISALEVDALDLSAFSADKPAITTRADDLAYIIFTSGSTGTPKGVVITHRSAVNTIEDINERFAVTADDRTLAISSLSFDLSVYDIFGLLAVGGAMVIPPNRFAKEPAYWAERVASCGITIWNSVPALVHIYSDYVAEQPQAQASSLRLVMMSGDWIPLTLPDRIKTIAPQAQIISLGGATEASIWSIYYPIEQVDATWKSIPYGKPLRNQRFQVLNDALEPCPLFVPGHLYIGGIGLAQGYWRDEERTAASFITHPRTGERLYKTGDLGRYLADGNIEFLGRDDFQVKIRGFRIELGDIEAALRAHPAVKEPLATVYGEGNNSQLAAYMTVNSGHAAEVSALQNWLRARLPAYMVPNYLMLLESFPLTANGKIDRKALPQPELTLTTSFEAARNDVEQTLADIWAALLSQRAIGIHDNFFELGGDSILSIQVVARARQAGLQLAVHHIFEFQTIAGLATVAQQGSAVQVDAEQGLVVGALPLTPVQHWLLAQELPELHHFNQSVLLSLPDDLNVDALRLAFAAVLNHHDALRLRYSLQDGAWQQHSVAELDDIPLMQQTIDEDDATGLINHSLACQQSLNLSDGPLTRMVLFQRGASLRLFWCIHHLAVDGVSWRTLLEDLHTAYNQYNRAETLKLPPKTSSYKAWAEHLQHYLHSEQLAAELPYWQSLSEVPLPIDIPGGTNSREYQQDITIALSADDTAALLREAPAAYNTRINDLLLAALALALTEWSGQSRALIEIEGHGRVGLFDDIDLSRSVGWFTTMHPVALSLPDDGRRDPGAVIKAVKEQLRLTPNEGIGYGLLRELAGCELPRADILFNYLGQFDQGIDAGDFTMVNEATGSAISSRGPRSHLIDINGAITQGQLSLSWSFSSDCYAAETIQGVADDFINQLQQLIHHCRQGRLGITPSDLPLARLGQTELDGLYAQHPAFEDLYPLTPMQQGLLFHSLYQQGGVEYFEQLLIELRHLDPQLFKAAWQLQLQRHPILRSAFLVEHQPMLQLVEKQAPLIWREHDWRDQAETAQHERLSELTARERGIGFDLSRAPLIRFDLIRMDEERYTFVIHFHHVLLDGWSVPLILDEVRESYVAMQHGKRPHLATLPPFRDYITWLQQQDRESSSNYWLERLAGFDTPTVLAIKQHNTLQAIYRKVRFSLDEDLSLQLQQFSQRQRITLNTIMQAVVALLLSRYSGHDDVCYGVTVSGRNAPLPGIESIVGMLINSLPLRLQLDQQQSVADFLLQLQLLHQADNRHAHASLADIQDNSELDAGAALFEVLLAVENYPHSDALSQPDDCYTMEAVSSQQSTNFPLTIMVDPAQQIDFYLLYDTCRISGESIERLWRHLQTLLTGIVAHMDQPISSLPMLAAEELQQLQSWCAPETAAVSENTLLELFEQQAAATPENIALICPSTGSGTEQLSYRQLDEKANQMAHHLLSFKLPTADCQLPTERLMAIAINRSPQMIISVLAVLKAGAAYVPIDPEYPAERIQRTLESSGAACLISHSHVLSSLTLPAGIHAVAEDELDLSPYPDDKPSIAVKPDDLAYIIFTSGSTGTPKGVVISHRSAVNTILDINERFGVGEQDRVLAVSSLSFDLSVYDIFGLLAVGGALVILPSLQAREPEYWSAMVQRHRVSIWNSVPALMQVYCDHQERMAAQHSDALRLVMMSGDWIPLTLPDRIRAIAPDAAVISLGGATEAAIWSIWYPIEQVDPAWTSIPYGKPLRNQSFQVLDVTLAPCPILVPGHLYIGGIGLAQGYWRDEEKTEASFITHPQTGERLYRTGDLGRYHPDGNIEFLGRDDFQVKVRGFRIELGDIEAAICRHPQVKVATAIVKQHEQGEQQLLAYFVPRSSRQQDHVPDQPVHWQTVADDCVVIDSNVHAFPSVNYLVEVIGKAMDAVATGGKLQIKNLRNLALLEAFHASNQLQKADAGLPLTELKRHIDHAVQREAGLLIHPDLFPALMEAFPRIRQVSIELKAATDGNDMNRFCYDVSLFLDQNRSLQACKWFDWQWGQLTTVKLNDLLITYNDEAVGITGIPNSQLMREQRMLQRLATAEGDVKQLREDMAALGAGVEVEALRELGDSSAMRCFLTYDSLFQITALYQPAAWGERPCVEHNSQGDLDE